MGNDPVFMRRLPAQIISAFLGNQGFAEEWVIKRLKNGYKFAG